jgi:hypothetical protein
MQPEPVRHTLRNPLSLATNHGISVDFFSFGYLDVSVHPVFTACICFFIIASSVTNVTAFALGNSQFTNL